MPNDLDLLLGDLAPPCPSPVSLEGLERRVWAGVDSDEAQVRARRHVAGVQLAVGLTALCLGFAYRVVGLQGYGATQIAAGPQAVVTTLDQRALGSGDFQAVR